ncbi:MAG: clan aspartic protease [Sphingobacteriaceae bacterium]|nr:clan aspartic protease [Sphingobacteriaceae bacterium]
MELNGEVSIIRLSDRVSTGLGTNSMESFTVVLPEIAIGTLVISGFEAAVIDLSSINYAYEQLGLPKVIGVIGGDILMDHKAVIDYGKKMLKLFVL